jgi:hypothetical protein
MHHASTHAVDPSVWIGLVNSLCNALRIGLPRRRLVGGTQPRGSAAGRHQAKRYGTKRRPRARAVVLA